MEQHYAQIEIFCGSGGVGKTTLSASRALHLITSAPHRKILLITIDPAKRLKDVLFPQENSNEKILSGEIIPSDLGFDVMIYNPLYTLRSLGKNDSKILDNAILKNLTSPFGGMNEIMAVVQLEIELQKKYYDSIILDTPPGNQFIDFLKATEKIENFFSGQYFEIFQFLKNQKEKKDESQSLFQKINLSSLIQSGIQKLLDYLEKVTGQGFVEEFIHSVHLLYQNRQAFLNSILFYKKLFEPNFCQWFFVVSSEQDKVSAMIEMEDHSKNFVHSPPILLINKTLPEDFTAGWQPTDEVLIQYQKSLIRREHSVIQSITKHFQSSLKIYQFPEIHTSFPLEHIKQLAKLY